MLARAQAQLRTTFGFPDFRGLQWPVIEHVLAGGDAVVLMPTGGGQSLCYQLPALLLDGAVTRTGALPHALVGDWVAACDVLAMVSRVEPLGVAALEALAGGRPVVVTEVGGAREIVGGTEAGRVVDPADPVAIAAALAAVIDDPPPPDACRAVAAAHALDIQADRVAAILRDAMAA